MINGVIVKGIGGFYYVSTPQGVIECRARGKFRKQGIKPCVGDKVGITVHGAQGAVEEIHTRRNKLIRPSVSNIDQIAVVIAAAMPQPDLFVVDKLIIQAEKNDIDILICINKIDLAAPDELASIYEGIGYPVAELCALEGAQQLKPFLEGRITAFAGNSGVGKSSLLNALGFELETGEISKIAHGRHTTRHVELMPFSNEGFVIDTPGFSLLDISHIRAEELSGLFPEFKRLPECDFKDCAHIGAKGCRVIEAVTADTIAKSRYESYSQLYNELKNIKEWDR